MPIEPDFVGIQIDSINSQKVLVKWDEVDGHDEVILLNEKKRIRINVLIEQNEGHSTAKYQTPPWNQGPFRTRHYPYSGYSTNI